MLELRKWHSATIGSRAWLLPLALVTLAALLLVLAVTPSPYWTLLFPPPSTLESQSTPIQGTFTAYGVAELASYRILLWSLVALGFLSLGPLVASLLVQADSLKQTDRERKMRSFLARLRGQTELIVATGIVLEIVLAFVVLGTEKFGFLSPDFARPPAEIVWHFTAFLGRYLLLSVPTLLRLTSGVVAGLVAGIALGLVFGRKPPLNQWSFPWFTVMAAIPPLLLHPVFTLIIPSQAKHFSWVHEHCINPDSTFVKAAAGLIGLITHPLGVRPFQEPFNLRAEDVKNEWILFLLVFWCVVWPVLQSVVGALSTVPSIDRTVQVARLCGSSWFRSTFSVLLPQLFPWVLEGVWLGIVIAFIVLSGLGESGTVPISVGVSEGKEGIAQLIHDSLTGGLPVIESYPVILFALLFVLAVRMSLVGFGALMMPWKYRGAGEPRESTSVASGSITSTTSATIESVVQFKARQLQGLLAHSRYKAICISIFGLRHKAYVASPGLTSVCVSDLRKTYSSLAIRVESLALPYNSHVSLIGPSGAGKSTLARIIAGVENPDPDSGDVVVCGKLLWRGNKRCTSPQDLQVAFVPQDYGLFPTMTVFDNVVFPLRSHGVSPREFEVPVAQVLHLFGITEKSTQYPYELSGGAQQRVALARALLSDARLLILDEPMSAVDQPRKDELLALLVRFTGRCAETHIPLTILSISHDNKEVLRISTTILYIETANIIQQATPRGLYFAPRTLDIARFVGHPNIFMGLYVFDGSDGFVEPMSLPNLPSASSRSGLSQLPIRLSVQPDPTLQSGVPVFVIVPKAWINLPKGSTTHSVLTQSWSVTGSVKHVEFCGTHIEFLLANADSGLDLWVALQEDEFRSRCSGYFIDGSLPLQLSLSVDDIIILAAEGSR